MEELIPIVMFLCIAAVMILRPLTKRIGLVIEQMARDRQSSRTWRLKSDVRQGR
jgi:hypothetical protein